MPHFYFLFNLFPFILFLELGLELEWQDYCQDRWWWTLFYFLFSLYSTFLIFFLHFSCFTYRLFSANFFYYFFNHFVKIVDSGLYFIFSFHFYFTFHFFFFFIFLSLEQLGLGFISHAATSVIKWWHSHKTDHGTWENEVEDSGTKWRHTAWTTHAGLMLYSWSFRVGCTVASTDHG